MNINFNYPDDVITLIKSKNIFNWYVNEKELWILDLEKFGIDINQKLKALGKQPENFIDEERKGLEILNSDNIDVFKNRIVQYKATYKELKEFFLLHSEVLYYRNAKEILPDFYIDFDLKIFYSYFSEPGSFEYYVPTGWKGILAKQIDPTILNSAIKQEQ